MTAWHWLVWVLGAMFFGALLLLIFFAGLGALRRDKDGSDSEW